MARGGSKGKRGGKSNTTLGNQDGGEEEEEKKDTALPVYDTVCLLADLSSVRPSYVERHTKALLNLAQKLAKVEVEAAPTVKVQVEAHANAVAAHDTARAAGQQVDTL